MNDQKKNMGTKKRPTSSSGHAERTPELNEPTDSVKSPDRTWDPSSVVKQLSDLTIILDHDLKCVYTSPFITKLSNIQPQNSEGKPVYSFVHVDDREVIDKLLEHSNTFPGEVFQAGNIRLKKGDDHWLHLDVLAITMPNITDTRFTTLQFMNIPSTNISSDFVSRSTDFSELIINSFPYPIDIVNKDFQILYQNTASIQAFGKCGEKKCFEHFHNKHVPCKYCSAINAIQDGKIYSRETPVVEGKIYTNKSIPVTFPDGTVHSMEIMWDISHKKHSEEELLRRTQDLEILNKIITAGNVAKNLDSLLEIALMLTLTLLDFDGGGIYLVDESLSFARLVCTQNLANGFIELVNEVKTDELPYRTIFFEKTPIFTDNYPEVNPNLSNKWGVLSLASIPLLSGNEIIGALNISSSKKSIIPEDERELLVTIGREIGTSIKKMKVEESLKESEQKYRSLIEDINDAIYSMDLSGNITYVSPVFERLFLYKTDELIGSNFAQYIHPDDLPLVLERIEGIMKEDYESLQYRLIDKDGTTVPVESSSRLIYHDENPVGITGVLRDITEKKKMQEQFIQAEKLSSLGEILSGVAHELNNPLTTIVGFSELLVKQEVPEGVKQGLNAIFREAIRSSKIVQSLLTFARKHAPEKRMINVNDVIQESHKLREYELGVDDVHSEIILSDDLPLTYADPYQLQQVFINLINNAHHALLEKSGGILRIRTYVERDSIHIVFEDNGPGIPDEHLNKIFDPFFTTKGVGKGTGLGLSVAFGIIDEHDGEIMVESESGNGTKFIIRIPVFAKVMDTAKSDTIDHEKLEGSLSILLVDDEELLRKFILTVLVSEGYYVRECGSGEGAIELLNQESFDVIISDMKMSGMGGKTLYTYIQKNHPDLVERVLFITGDVLGRETQSFLEITGCKYLEKPFTASKLLACLTELLKQ